MNPVSEAPEIQYCVNKTGIKALVCADKFKHYDYYESLLTIVPEMEKCDPGKIKSTQVPSLKTVIIMGDKNKWYYSTRNSRFNNQFFLVVLTIFTKFWT